jgi:hypothetical protein
MSVRQTLREGKITRGFAFQVPEKNLDGPPESLDRPGLLKLPDCRH